MKLYLTNKGTLNTENAKLLTKIEKDTRRQYNDFIGELIKQNNVDGIEWLAHVTSRNTFSGILYDRMCKLSLLEHLITSRESISVVIVDSRGMGDAVKQICSRHSLNINIIYEKSLKRNFIYLLVTNFLKSIYLIANMWFWPKLISRSTPLGTKPLIIIDTFLYPDSFKADSSLLARNYPGLLDNVNHITDKYDVVLTPTFYSIRTPIQFIKAYWRTSKSNESVFLKEYCLQFSDYLRAIINNYIIPFRITKYPVWNGLDISKIVVEERNEEYSTTTLLNSLFIYYFFRRISKQNRKLGLVIDWNENQTIDRSLNLAVKKYHPGSYVVGYQGFIAPGYYLSVNPTSYEMTGNTLPDEICVIGKSYKKEKLAQCGDLNITTAPAFRFQEIIELNQKNRDKIKKNRVVVALPLFINSCSEIIRLCQDVANTLNEMEFIIKYHPAHNQKEIKGLVKITSNKIEFTEKRIRDLLETASILISEASSVCMEAAVLGIPVAIVGSHIGPTMNPLEDLVPNRAWEVVYNKEDLINFIMDNVTKINQKIIEIDNFFEKDDGLWLQKLVQKIESR